MIPDSVRTDRPKAGTGNPQSAAVNARRTVMREFRSMAAASAAESQESRRERPSMERNKIAPRTASASFVTS
jgi:hypothetical protein